MNCINLKFIQKLTLLALAIFSVSCSEDDPVIEEQEEATAETKYFVGLEAGTDPATDVLSSAVNLNSGTLVSAVENGFEQPTWMSFYQNDKQIFAAGYTSAPEFTSYILSEEGELIKEDSFFTDQGIYALDILDNSTMVLMGSPREGVSDKKIYIIDTKKMEITKTVETNFDVNEENQTISFPVDLKVRDSKLFVAYYMVSSAGDFSTPDANEAKIAVYSYPGLEFEKIITDDRAPNVGRYYSSNVLEEDEKGDIYTYSSSSLACGFAPAPETNSGILRIQNGETTFDENYHIDFETLSGGYKINDLYYVSNGKAVVRVLKEDETNADYLWATYAPNSPQPLLETGIIDLYNETFTLLSEVPKGGGGWVGAHLIEGDTLYLGVSSSTYADIYAINVTTETAIKGASIDGNYAKGLLSLTAGN